MSRLFVSALVLADDGISKDHHHLKNMSANRLPCNRLLCHVVVMTATSE